MRTTISATSAVSLLIVALGCAEAPTTLTAPPTPAVGAHASWRGSAGEAASPGAVRSQLDQSKCLTAAGESPVAGGRLVSATCRPGDPRQQLSFTTAGELRTAAGGLCVDVAGGAGVAGAATVLGHCDGRASQRWVHTAPGELRGTGDKCFDIEGESRAEGARVILWTCHGKANQRWTLATPAANPTTPAPAAAGLVVSRLDASKCVTASGGQTAVGGRLVSSACDAGDARQAFALATTGELRTAAGLCAATERDASADGTAIVLAACDGRAAHRWTSTAAGELRGVAGKCLDISGASRRDGAALILWSCHGRANQRWIMLSPPAPAQPTAATLAATLGQGTVGVGQTTSLAVQARDAGGRELSGLVPMWSSSHPAVATVSATGVVTGRSSGTATLTASVGNRSAATTVTVVASHVVPVAPGQNIQAAVDANAEGTAFLVRAGVHRRQSVVPKHGNAFIGEPGAVLDGEYAVPYAFRWADWRVPNDVRVQGLRIEHYATPKQFGAVLAGWHQPHGQTTGWVIQDNEIRYNGGGGIRIGHGTRVLRNKVHHNEQIGIVGVGDDVLVEGNEISYNNYGSKYDIMWEAGGTKFIETNGLVVRGNFSHHNTGPGFWSDIDNRTTLYENNRVEDNTGVGIHMEISYGFVVRHNQVRRNGFGIAAWLHGAGIFVQNTSDVEIYGNTVEANYNGITGTHQNRGGGRYGVWRTRNVRVHDNVIVMPTGWSGFAQDVGDASMYAPATMRFERNTYKVGRWREPFAWNSAFLTEAQWRAVGQDVAGTVTR